MALENETADHEKKDDDDNVDRRVIERFTLFMQFTNIMTGTPSLLHGLLSPQLYSIKCKLPAVHDN